MSPKKKKIKRTWHKKRMRRERGMRHDDDHEDEDEDDDAVVVRISCVLWSSGAGPSLVRPSVGRWSDRSLVSE